MTKLLGACLTTITLLLATFCHADDLASEKRICLNSNSIGPDQKSRVMLFTSKFSIYPQFNQPTVFLMQPAIQGVNPLAAMVGAIAGTLIVNGSNTSTSNSAAAFNNELNSALASININAELRSAIETELSKNESFKKLEFEEVAHINDLSQAGLLTRIEEPSTLTLATRIYFDAQLKSLNVESSAKIWKKNEVKPVYFSELVYSSPYLAESSKADLRQKWVSNNSELLLTKIREGIVEISRMLASDISSKPVTDSNEIHPMMVEITNANTSKKLKTTLYAVQEMPDRLIGRLGSPDSSILTSIPRTNFAVLSSN
ncbi:MAG TPA: hypothetical protein VIE91_02815 [Methylophilaceae bacterium]|jgi:hypothetical protein